MTMSTVQNAAVVFYLFIYVVVVDDINDDDDDDVDFDCDLIVIINVVFVVFAYQCLLVTECSPSGSGHIQLRSSQQAQSYQRPVGSNTSSTL